MTRLRSRRAALWLGLAAALAACGGSSVAEPGAQLYAHDGPRYRVVVERAVPDAALRAWVAPRDPWHIATEFPFELQASGEGVAVEPERQQRGAALEISEERVEFAIPVATDAPSPGARVRGRLAFGICQTDQICERVVHEFALTLR